MSSTRPERAIAHEMLMVKMLMVQPQSSGVQLNPDTQEADACIDTAYA